MTETISNDSRLSLPAIVAGAATAFIVNLAIGFAITGFAIVAYQANTWQNISAEGYATLAILRLVKSFVAFAAGGYVAGYFSPQSGLFESRLHGFTAFALASLVIGLYMATPGSVVMQHVYNTTTSFVAAPGAANFAIPLGVGFHRPPSAGTFFFTAVLLLESAAAGFWAAGEAYLSRNRRSVTDIEHEAALAA